METRVLTIKPPLQIVDIGNGCKAYSASIYIPAKSELMTTIQSIMQSQFFLDYNFNYTNVCNFLIWHKTNFATVNTLLLQITVSNLPDLENQLFQLYTEINGVVHDFLPEDYDDMPSLEDIMDNES